MKKIFLFCLLCTTLESFGQVQPKSIALYYLIDTANTPLNERLWTFETNDQFKSYTLNCPCLENNGKPRFYYSVSEIGNPAEVVSKSGLRGFRLISLNQLIIKAKQVLDNKIDSEFYFIEPYEKKYIIHHVNLRNSAKQIISPPDVYILPPDTSSFIVKGLIRIDANKIGNYQNKAIITNCSVVNTKVLDGYNGKVLLFVGNDYPNQLFTIIIKGENRDKFDAPELKYKNKQIKVTGIVSLYEGKPAIEINKENQLQDVTHKFKQ